MDPGDSLTINPTSATTVQLGSLWLKTSGASISTASVTATSSPDTLTIDTAGLTVDSGSKFDLNNSQMYINYGSSTDPISTIQGYLTSGYATGAWTGSGINSTAAASDATQKHAIGYKDASNSIHLMYTVYGDADLSGTVDAGDYATVVRNFGASPATWDEGDFNYNGAVDINDYNTVVRNFGDTV